jgi:hypothetical protein
VKKLIPWGVGVGCGCLTVPTVTVAIAGLAVLFSYLTWEVGGIRTSFNSGPASLMWGPPLGVIIGLILALVVLLVVRTILAKLMGGQSPDE